MVRHFFANELESLAYLIYAFVIYLQYRHYKLKRYGILFAYHVIAAIILFLGIQFSLHNDWTYNIVFLLNICVFSWYFLQLFESRAKKIITIATCILNLCVFIYYDLFEARFLSVFNSTAYGITFLSILLYCLFYLHQLLIAGREENPLMNFDFWLVCGYLIYFLGSFVIVIYYENAAETMRGDMWILHNIILFICSFIMVAVYFNISKKLKNI